MVLHGVSDVLGIVEDVNIRSKGVMGHSLVVAGLVALGGFGGVVGGLRMMGMLSPGRYLACQQGTAHGFNFDLF